MSEQRIVLKVTLKFDPVALVAWAKSKEGVCCNYPAHDPEHLDFVEPELQAVGIMAHALLSAVEEITTGGSVVSTDNGIPEEMAKRIGDEYEETVRGLEERKRISPGAKE